MLKIKSVKVNKELLDKGKDIMRDPQFPFENDTVLFSVALSDFYEEWHNAVDKIKFYNKTMEKVERLQKKGMVDPNPRNIRPIEDIKDA